MQNPHTARTLPQRKIPKFLDTKMLIASLSIAVTVGIWNLLANDAYLAARTPPEPNTAPPPQADPVQGAEEGLPIPTIVPLFPVTILTLPAQPSAPTAGQPAAGQLRSVTAPTQTVIQKVKPQVGQAVNVMIVNGGGDIGGGGGGGGAVATTSSSR